MAVTDYKDNKLPHSVPVDPVFYYQDEATGSKIQVNGLTEILKALGEISGGANPPQRHVKRFIERVAEAHTFTISAPLNWLLIVGPNASEVTINDVKLAIDHELQSSYGEGNLPNGIEHNDVKIYVEHSESVVIWEAYD